MNGDDKRTFYPRGLYLWLSIVLYAPMLMLPLRLQLASGVPAYGVDIEAHWLLLASMLLLVAVVADSILMLAEHQHSIPLMALSALFVFVVALFIPWLISHPAHGWWLGLLFMLHATRSGWLLWRDEPGWWVLTAWLRDCTAAITVFYWLWRWPAY